MLKTQTGSASIAVIAILLIVAIPFVIMNLWAKPQNCEIENPLLKDGEMPILVAHRGGDGEFPGNTLEAFTNAYSVDSRVLMETDVNLTKDGVLILCHETYLDKRTNVKGDIADWNYSDLIEQKVDFGYHNSDDSALKHFTAENGECVYPRDLEGHANGLEGRDSEVFLATTLRELLTAFPENIVSVEIKQGGELGLKALDALLALVRELDAFDRVIFASFHDEIYKEYQRLDASGEVPETFMYSPAMGAAVKYYVLYLLGADVFFGDTVSVLQLPMEEYGFNLATKRLINNAHKHNIAVHYWTINSEDDMRTLIENGADAIMTDYPHKLASVYAQYNS